MAEKVTHDPKLSSSKDSSTESDDEGPGCMPAILAATLLLGMVISIGCGISGWWIFTKRTEIAIKTLETTFIPQVEQSRLTLDEKTESLRLLNEFLTDMKSGRYENWQTSGVMQRFQRLPLLQWGELWTIEAFATSQGGELADDATLQLSRLRRAIELSMVTSLHLEDVLRPVTVRDDSLDGRSLIQPLTVASVTHVIQLAKEQADRSEVPEKIFPDVRIEVLLRRQIESGLRDGTY